MRLLVLRCDAPNIAVPSSAEVHDLPRVPSRRELTMLDDAAFDVLPHDPTPSLDEIARQPDVEHLGAPKPPPQRPAQPLRIVVVGSDASLSAVLTRLMRADHLWAEIGYVPVDPSPAAHNWGLPTSIEDALDLALNGSPTPTPLIRDDAATAVAGSATVTDWDADEITGEVIVDDAVLLRHQASDTQRTPRQGVFGSKLVPMRDAPGIAAVVLATPISVETDRRGFFARFRRQALGTVSAETLKTGRALQAGGLRLRIEVDGIPRKRPVERVTFYRHLRDLQIIRPS